MIVISLEKHWRAPFAPVNPRNRQDIQRKKAVTRGVVAGGVIGFAGSAVFLWSMANALGIRSSSGHLWTSMIEVIFVTLACAVIGGLVGMVVAFIRR